MLQDLGCLVVDRDFSVEAQSATDLFGFCVGGCGCACGCDGGVESHGWKHLWRSHDEIQGLHSGAVEFVHVEARNVVVWVCVD